MSHNDLLRIQNLKVCAGEKEILHGIDLDIHENEVHVLMGPNGTGKSTLGAALMGNPAYTVTGGDIIYKGQNINEMPDNERAKNGIFLSFQNPIEIPGITVSCVYPQCTGSQDRQACPSVQLQKGTGRKNGTAPDGSVLCRA